MGDIKWPAGRVLELYGWSVWDEIPNGKFSLRGAVPVCWCGHLQNRHESVHYALKRYDKSGWQEPYTQPCGEAGCNCVLWEPVFETTGNGAFMGEQPTRITSDPLIAGLIRLHKGGNGVRMLDAGRECFVCHRARPVLQLGDYQGLRCTSCMASDRTE